MKHYERPALVLSGGGANGAFQVTAEKFCREVMGLKWVGVAGQSAGALNGAMVAMQRYEELLQLWKRMDTPLIYTPFSRWRLLMALVRRELSVLSNAPLLKLLEEAIPGHECKVPFRFGAVSLETGHYVRFTEDDVSPETLKASASIPLVWPPVETMIDGGVLNNGPISEVLAFDPDLIVVINCKARLRGLAHKPMPTNLLEVATRVLDIVMDESFRNDFEIFTRLNDVVAQAADYNARLPPSVRGIELMHSPSRPYRHFDCIFIEPDEDLGSPLDFSPQRNKDRMGHGWARAVAAFREAGWLT